MEKKFYEVLIDSLNGLADDNEKRTTTFMLFMTGACSSIIKKTAQSISESGETPTIRKLINKLDSDVGLIAEISTILHNLLQGSVVVDPETWDRFDMSKEIEFNFERLDEKLKKVLAERSSINPLKELLEYLQNEDEDD